GMRDKLVTGVQTCALPIYSAIGTTEGHEGWTLIFWSIRRESAGQFGREGSAELGAGAHAELAVDDAQLVLDGLGGDEKRLGDLRSEERRVGKGCGGPGFGG